VPKILTYQDDFQEFIRERTAGNLCVVDEELYMYFLEVLPPAFMYRTVTLNTGREIRAEFGFAEGAEQVTAFWRAKEPQGTVHYAQLCQLWSRG
jgi:hypothetical protein